MYMITLDHTCSQSGRDDTLLLFPFPLSAAGTADWMAGTLAAILECEIALRVAPSAGTVEQKEGLMLGPC